MGGRSLCILSANINLLKSSKFHSSAGDRSLAKVNGGGAVGPGKNICVLGVDVPEALFLSFSLKSFPPLKCSSSAFSSSSAVSPVPDFTFISP